MEEELSGTLVQWEKRWFSPPGPIFLSFHFHHLPLADFALFSWDRKPSCVAILKDGPLALLELLPLHEAAAAHGRLLTVLVVGLLKF